MLLNVSRKLGKIFVCIALLVNVGILIKAFLPTQSASKQVAQKISKKTKVVDTTPEPNVDSDGRIDWHDYAFMAYEKNRTGPGLNTIELKKNFSFKSFTGEQGRPHKLTDEQDILLDKQTFNDEGFSIVVSDQISPNRALSDVRHDKSDFKLKMVEKETKFHVSAAKLSDT